MNRLTALLFALILEATAFAQSSYSPETLQKIRALEKNVTGPLQLNNEKPPTLEERMAKNKVKGMSIAVIHCSYQCLCKSRPLLPGITVAGIVAKLQ